MEKSVIQRDDTVCLFTRNGMGRGPEDLQLALAQKVISL